MDFALGDVWIGSMWMAVKARDLRRDPRYAIHSGSDDPPGWKGDAKIAGRVEEVDDAEVKAAVDGFLGEVPSIETVIVVRNTPDDAPMTEGRDVWYEEAIEAASGVERHQQRNRPSRPLRRMQRGGTRGEGNRRCQPCNEFSSVRHDTLHLALNCLLNFAYDVTLHPRLVPALC